MTASDVEKSSSFDMPVEITDHTCFTLHVKTYGSQHMLHFPRYGRQLERFQTAKVTFKVTQGHCYWFHLIGHIRFHVSFPLQLCVAILYRFRYIITSLQKCKQVTPLEYHQDVWHQSPLATTQRCLHDDLVAILTKL